MSEHTHPPAPLALPAPDAGESRFSPVHLWGSVRKNWVIVMALTVVAAVGATFFTLGQTRSYEASAVILFDTSTLQPLGSDVDTAVDVDGFLKNREYQKTQYWIIKSRRTADAVVQALRLDQDASFVAGLPAKSKVAPRAGAAELAAQRLSNQLTVEPIRDSRLTIVKFRDADPERAHRIVAAVVDTYVQANLDELTEASTLAADWLHNQLGSLKESLESSEMALHEYKKNKNILSVSMDDQSNMLRGEMQQISSALTTVRTRREQVASRREQLLKVPPDDPANLPVTELLANGALQALRTQYVDAAREVDGLMAGGRDVNHPEVRAALSKKATTRVALLAEIKNLQGAIDGDLAALNHEVGGLSRLFESTQQRALDLNLLEIEFNRLRRSKDTNDKLFSLVVERSKESDLTKMLRINNIRVVERPQLPKLPVTPNVPMNIAGGLLAGLMLGLAAAIGREQLDRSIKTPDDAERELGAPFLGLLPSVSDSASAAGSSYGGKRKKKRRSQAEEAPLGAMELIVHDRPMSGIAEAARAIRTNVLFLSPDRPYRTLLVTSAGPSEGKTTVACCIAIAMAQAGKRVVLVDCDMRRPRIHKVFGKDRDLGITTAILEQQPRIQDILHPTDVPNLSIVTTGPLPPNPAEILHSAAFAKVLAGLREQFDTVILDSPPIVPVTDAAVLSTLVDGTVIVVRAFQTSKDLARRAVRAVRDVGGHLVGVVLNAVDLDRHEYGYHYYYYYKREGYASDEAPSRTSNDAPAPPPA